MQNEEIRLLLRTKVYERSVCYAGVSPETNQKHRVNETRVWHDMHAKSGIEMVQQNNHLLWFQIKHYKNGHLIPVMASEIFEKVVNSCT